jgi:hypothetical protein
LVGTLRFAHPHMGPLESSILTGAWVLFLSHGAAAVRGAMRSAAYRRGRRAQGLASGDLCSCSLHHLISGRTAMARTHIPHACGEEAMRMRPIYETACLLALGWHGHHPSRADRGRCRDADAFVKSWGLRRLEHRPCGHKTGCQVTPKRHHQLARQGHNGDAPDARAGIERALPEPLA